MTLSSASRIMSGGARVNDGTSINCDGLSNSSPVNADIRMDKEDWWVNT